MKFLFVCVVISWQSGECIMKTWACDLDPDCPDGSDEENCHYNTTTTPTPVNPFRTNCNGSQMFECNLTKTCIPVFWKCDGVCDCGSDQDCSDEEDCGKKRLLLLALRYVIIRAAKWLIF